MAVAVVIVVTLIGLLGVLLICKVASWQRTPRGAPRRLVGPV